MLRSGEHAQEPQECYLKTVLRLLRGRVSDRRLFPEHELQLRNEVHDELTVRTECLAQGSPPPAKLRLALAQKRADKALEGLNQGGVRDVALVLVELSGREHATRPYEHPVQLVHHRGLADAGIARHEHEFRCTIGHDPVKGSEQSLDLALPPIQPLRDHELVRRVLCADRERVDPSERLPCCEASAKSSLDASGGLVPLLRGPWQPPHHGSLERCRK